MHFKVLIFSLACFAFFVKPAQSFGIETAANTLGNVVSIPFEIAAIPIRVARAKAAAVVKGVADVASIFVTGAGLKVRALGTAVSSIKGAMANGIIDLGQTIQNAGNTISGNMASGSANMVSGSANMGSGSSNMGSGNGNSGNTRVLVASPVAEEVVEEVKVRAPSAMELAYSGPYEQEIIEVPVQVREPITLVESVPRTNKVSAVWNTMNNARLAEVNNEDQVFIIRRDPAESSVVYEIAEGPHHHRHHKRARGHITQRN